MREGGREGESVLSAYVGVRASWSGRAGVVRCRAFQKSLMSLPPSPPFARLPFLPAFPSPSVFM